MSGREPTLAVVYDDGAASVGEIAVGLAGLGRVVFLVPDNPHTSLLRPVMDSLGEVRVLSGRAAEDAAMVANLAPDAVLTFSEQMIRATAELAGALGLPGHDPDVARDLTDKVRQRRALRDGGVDDVRWHPLRSPADWPAALAAVSLPAVVKPVRGGGSRDTYAIATEADAARIIPTLTPGTDFTVEEMLGGRPSDPYGDYVSVESVCTPQGSTHLAVTGKLPLLEPFRETGSFWPAALPPDEERAVRELTTRALTALGVSCGLTHTEVKLTPAGPRIIEVNGRLSGLLNLVTRAGPGVDLVEVAGRLALGERPDLGPLDFRGRVHFMVTTPAPTRRCRLVRVDGAREVRALPGVAGLRLYAKPGDQLTGGVHTNPLDVLWGACDRHADLQDTIRRALDLLSYEFVFPDGSVLLASAAELVGW